MSLVVCRSIPSSKFFRVETGNCGRRKTPSSGASLLQQTRTSNCFHPLPTSCSQADSLVVSCLLHMLLPRLSALGRPLAGLGRRSLPSRGLSITCDHRRAAGSREGDAQPGVASEQGRYRDTVLLPRTDFPMKLSGQKLLERELQIQKVKQSNMSRDFGVLSVIHFLCVHVGHLNWGKAQCTMHVSTMFLKETLETLKQGPEEKPCRVLTSHITAMQLLSNVRAHWRESDVNNRTKYTILEVQSSREGPVESGPQ